MFKCDLRVSYFEKIDSEIKAYLLGLFIADGCIYKNKNSGSKLFNIQLQNEDSYMIEFIKNELNIQRKIVIDKGDNSACISVTNNIFVEHLEKYGMVQNKEKRYIPKLDDHLIHHCIRGLFDGDGSITYKSGSNRRREQWCFVISAHGKIIYNLNNFLINRLSLNNNKLCNEGADIFISRWSSVHDFLALGEYLYKDATIYLKRKFEKYQIASSAYLKR